MGRVSRMMVGAAGSVFVCAMLISRIADAAPATGHRQGPCSDDFAKFCKDVQPGGGRIAQCLKQHEQELSPACKQHAAEVKKRGKEFRAACEDDVLNHCAGVQPGGGRIVNCLKQHEQELTADCRTKMQQKQTKGK